MRDLVSAVESWLAVFPQQDLARFAGILGDIESVSSVEYTEEELRKVLELQVAADLPQWQAQREMYEINLEDEARELSAEELSAMALEDWVEYLMELGERDFHEAWSRVALEAAYAAAKLGVV